MSGGLVRPVAALERAELAVLVREYLLAGQLMDRSGMPHLIAAHGREAMGHLAIEEWMGASPIYTRRTQRLLGFEGDDVVTLFKCLQLDIGAPPEFMDFRLRVIDEQHGEFWLDHCGALMDVEPMGEEFVRTMCHDIEDPTFDATATAVNPRARIRPIHRPPRTPADRHPHCHWTATIDPSAEPLPAPAEARRVAASSLAAIPVPPVDADPDAPGRDDYRGPLDPDLRLEVFSAAALRGLAHEVAVQTHLLAMSLLAAVERRDGRDAAVVFGRAYAIGSVGLTAERLRSAFGLDDSLAAVAQVLEWHPLLQPRSYVRAAVALDPSTDALELELAACPAIAEPELLNWQQLLLDDDQRILDALVQGVDAHYRCERVATAGAAARWRVVRDDVAHPEAREVALTRFSTGATFRFSETPVELR